VGKNSFWHQVGVFFQCPLLCFTATVHVSVVYENAAKHDSVQCPRLKVLWHLPPV
jgi:hypothetical protein